MGRAISGVPNFPQQGAAASSIQVGPTMFLYNLTLQRPGAVTQAVAGSFSAPKAQEIVAARGDYLELLRPDDSGKVETIHR